jgi:hypothetical protein
MDELRAEDPRWIGGYRLLGRLGTGGMGRVYLGRSPRGRTVAVKLVRAELAEQDEFRTRFRREVGAARRVGGRWTAPVLDADTEADIPWVATGYVAGPSLQQVVATGYGPLPEASVRVLASGLAHALADIHAAGLVHRDLKPSNVMITIDGPRVIDFGIARALETVADDGQVTYTGAMVGSPAFMSPEQVRGDRVTPACDIFCLGSVLAYAASGLQPFGAAASGVHAQMYRIVQEPPDLDAVPEGLRELVAACLVKEPELRPSLVEVQERLAASARGTAADGGTDGNGTGTEGSAPGTDGDGTGVDGRPADPGARTRDEEPWLPGAIVVQLGRQAVRLLELEAAETGSVPVVSLPAAAATAAAQDTAVVPPAAATGPGSGAGTGPGTGPDSGTGPGPATGTGPDSGTGPGPATGTGPDSGTGPGPATGTGPGPGPATGTGPGGGTRPGTGRPGAQAAPEPAAAHAPPQPSPAPPPHEPRPGRGRGTALVTVLAVIAVIAAGTTAFVVVRDERAGHGGTAAPPAKRPAASAPASAATAAPGPTATAAAGSGGTAPSDMVGTWQATFDGGSTPGDSVNTRTLTIRSDGTAELVGDGPTYTCAWSMHVTSEGPPVGLSPSVVTRAEPASSCLPGEATTLTLVDPTHLRRDNLDPAKEPLTYEKTG